ncbi:MAG: hypothetical protein A2583_14135 [Bdellovibrionales bacterium RIFOXYD1_FULL_53_11]|nr:MAG: hypothetical protein A2583_14135 [Bdellovibrionales bacterium RIFOXYD1_FULL_53_11]
MLYILSFFLIVELLVRLLYWKKKGRLTFAAPDQWLNKNLKKNAYLTHPYISYVKKPHVDSMRYPSNNLGYCGKKNIGVQKQKDITRIYVCGGSTAEQNDIDQLEPFDPGDTWPALLEKSYNANHEKKIELINAGVSGYTSIESLIEFMLRGVYLEPDIAVFYHGINDAWLAQSVAGFRTDYSHTRKTTSFEDRYVLPDFRYLFSYQYAVMKLLSLKKPKGLLDYMVLEKPFKTDLAMLEKKSGVFKNNVRMFCHVCRIHNIVPVLVPWQYKPELIKHVDQHEMNDDEIKKFIDLLEMNNRALKETAEENDNVKYLDISGFEPDDFRKDDWIHFSRAGLEKMADKVYSELNSLM